MNAFDVFGYHMINHLAGHIALLDKIMAFIAKDALELYAVLFVVAWFKLPKPEVKKRHALIVMGFSGILALLFNVVISHIWFRPRPFVTLPKGSFEQLIPHPADASFPSDHTAGSFGFAAGSWKQSEGWVSKSFTILAILVAIARVYCGLHWPTDVLAGVVIGIVSAVIMRKFNSVLRPLTEVGLRIFRYGKYAKSVSVSQRH